LLWKECKVEKNRWGKQT